MNDRVVIKFGPGDPNSNMDSLQEKGNNFTKDISFATTSNGNGEHDSSKQQIWDSKTCNRGVQQEEFFKTMNEMRHKQELCDIVLCAEGSEMQVHKVVLAACSNFFRAMFASNMSEAQTSRVELKDISFKTVKSVVNFAYTADVPLSEDNVQELLSAANQYQIQPMKDACSDFLKLQLSASNCIGIRDFADYHNCTELKSSAIEFIDKQFEDVYKGEEFLQMELESVCRLLSRNELTVRCEDEVYEAAMAWIKYSTTTRLVHKKKVLSRVRFQLITRKYLIGTVQREPLLQDCCECLKMIIEGMQHHLTNGEESAVLINEITPRVKKQHYQVAVFGGSEEHGCQYFDPKDLTWSDFPVMNEKRRDHAVARVNNNVYVIAGSYLFNMSKIDCYNVATQSWNVMDSRLENCRDNVAVCSTKEGLIFITGGTQNHGTMAMRNAECFTPNMDKLVDVQPMNQSRYEHGLVECGVYLYACGGCVNQNSPLRTCEKYNKSSNKWTAINPMLQSRRGLGLVTVNNKMYAIGGQDENGALDTIECYDPVHGKWTKKHSMPYRLRTVKCAVVDESIWVVAGYRDMGRLNTVLEYNTKLDRWNFHYNTKAFQTCNVAVVAVDTCAVEG